MLRIVVPWVSWVAFGLFLGVLSYGCSSGDADPGAGTPVPDACSLVSGSNERVVTFTFDAQGPVSNTFQSCGFDPQPLDLGSNCMLNEWDLPGSGTYFRYAVGSGCGQPTFEAEVDDPNDTTLKYQVTFALYSRPFDVPSQDPFASGTYEKVQKSDGSVVEAGTILFYEFAK
jgi:hypothetical protein